MHRLTWLTALLALLTTSLASPDGPRIDPAPAQVVCDNSLTRDEILNYPDRQVLDNTGAPLLPSPTFREVLEIPPRPLFGVPGLSYRMYIAPGSNAQRMRRHVLFENWTGAPVDIRTYRWRPGEDPRCAGIITLPAEGNYENMWRLTFVPGVAIMVHLVH